MFSATLLSPEIKKMSEEICKFPTWVDLKGKDSVPEVIYFSLCVRVCVILLLFLIPYKIQTVYHAAVIVDPASTDAWVRPLAGFKTDGVHARGTTTFSLFSVLTRTSI